MHVHVILRVRDIDQAEYIYGYVYKCIYVFRDCNVCMRARERVCVYVCVCGGGGGEFVDILLS